MGWKDFVFRDPDEADRIISGVKRDVGQVRDDAASVKAERQEERKSGAGSSLIRWGVTLTLVVTVPIVGFALFGFVGLAVGLLVAAAVVTVRR